METISIIKNSFLIKMLTILFIFNSCKNADFSQKAISETPPPNQAQSNKCASDQYYDSQNDRCLIFECKEYVELPGSILDVPERDFVKGTCFYSKAISAPLEHIHQRTSLNILSRNHDNYSENIAPKEIGFSRFNLKLNDRRALKLVGQNKDLESKIHVDNYVLVRMNKEESIKAYGTRDASFLTGTEIDTYSDFVKYNNMAVPLTHFGDGGISHVLPIDITSTYPVGVSTDLNIDALDCGGGQYLEDIYLLIQ